MGALLAAQPILLSHHLLAHFWAFERDARRLEAARKAANVSPLGAAALGGTPHPIDPDLTAKELGMRPLVNSLDAVSDRDFALDLLYACAVLGVHLSRLGEEWVLWTSAEFGFATLDDAYSSGPHQQAIAGAAKAVRRASRRPKRRSSADGYQPVKVSARRARTVRACVQPTEH